MNMFKPVGARNDDEYISLLEADRKAAILRLDKIIKQTTPSLKRYFAYNMLGYGKFKYRNYKNEVIDWPVVALASQKNYMSLYICAMDGDQYIPEKYKDSLGKVSVGKSCIRFKKLEDLDMASLKKVLKLAEKQPGLS